LNPLAVIFLIAFLDLLGAGILIPVTPFLVKQYASGGLAVGLMMTAFSTAQFLASPVLGVLSDRHGRRLVLLVSLAGTAIGYFLFGWAGSFWMLLFSRILDGVTGGNISTVQAYIADVSKPEDRSKNFGLVGAAFGLGFIVGPALGGVLAKFGMTVPAFAAGGLSLLTLTATWFFLPESLPVERRRQEPLQARDLNPLRQILAAIGRKELAAILAALFLVNFAMAGLQSNFGLFALDRFAIGPGTIAGIFAAIGLTGALTQGLLIRRIGSRFNPFQLALTGCGLALSGFAAIAVSPAAWWLFPACMVISLGMGLLGPSLMGLLSGRVAPEEQGMILGVTQALGSLTRVIGPIWAGLIYDGVAQGSPYAFGSACILAAAVIARAASRASATPASNAASTPSSRAVPSGQ
jgi:multidrug resistance protein